MRYRIHCILDWLDRKFFRSGMVKEVFTWPASDVENFKKAARKKGMTLAEFVEHSLSEYMFDTLMYRLEKENKTRKKK